MIMFLAFFVPAVLFSVGDLRPDWKSGNWKILAVYLAVMALAVVLCVCVLRQVPLKSPSDIVTGIVKAIFPPLG